MKEENRRLSNQVEEAQHSIDVIKNKCKAAPCEDPSPSSLAIFSSISFSQRSTRMLTHIAMNYIGLLNKEEKLTLCEIITGKEFKELFKRNEQKFSKIQKGFRAKSLTEQHALSIRRL